jgi:hypothetical protein
MNKAQIFDRDGKPVSRSNGVLASGDCVRVPLRMMDSMFVDPRLAKAMQTSDGVKRIENFDKAQHMADVAKLSPAQLAVYNALKPRMPNLAEALKYAKRDVAAHTPDRAAALVYAGHIIKPHAVMHRPGFATMDANSLAQSDARVTARDARLSNAWSSGLQDDGHKTIKPPAPVPLVAASAADRLRLEREKKLNDAWKTPPHVNHVDAAISASISGVPLAVPQDANAVAHDPNTQPADARDQRISNAWK